MTISIIPIEKYDDRFDHYMRLVLNHIGYKCKLFSEPVDKTIKALKDGDSRVIFAFDSATNTVQGSLVFMLCDTDCFELHVSKAFIPKDAPKNVMFEGLKFLVDFGIIVGVDKITFASPRSGWLKLSKKLGFVPEKIVDGVQEYGRYL